MSHVPGELTWAAGDGVAINGVVHAVGTVGTEAFRVRCDSFRGIFRKAAYMNDLREPSQIGCVVCIAMEP